MRKAHKIQKLNNLTAPNLDNETQIQIVVHTVNMKRIQQVRDVIYGQN
jgi:hypothetical protein